jgi:hypothetical protein
VECWVLYLMYFEMAIFSVFFVAFLFVFGHGGSVTQWYWAAWWSCQ